MRTFSFFIEDDRSSVPNLEFVTVENLARAKAFAADSLAASSHHLSVEVWERERLLFRVSQDPNGRADDAEPTGARKQAFSL